MEMHDRLCPGMARKRGIFMTQTYVVPINIRYINLDYIYLLYIIIFFHYLNIYI